MGIIFLRIPEFNVTIVSKVNPLIKHVSFFAKYSPTVMQRIAKVLQYKSNIYITCLQLFCLHQKNKSTP